MEAVFIKSSIESIYLNYSVDVGVVSDSMSLAWGQVRKNTSLKHDIFLTKENKSKNTPFSIVLSIILESNTTIFRYSPTHNISSIDNDILMSCLQNYFTMVLLLSSELESRLGLENPIQLGLYCTVIGNISESKCALLPALTSYSIITPRYGRVGAEYNSCLTANNARRLVVCGFLTTRSPNLITVKGASMELINNQYYLIVFRQIVLKGDLA